MINKFFVFRKLVDFVADHSNVIDADMNNYADLIEIHGEDENGTTIKIEVSIKNKEVNKDD